MKQFIMAALLSALAFSAQAQQMPPNMNGKMMQHLEKMQSLSPEEQKKYMQNLMDSANRMQECYEAAGGEEGMKELEARGRTVKTEIETLCAAGERTKAQNYAHAETMKMMQDPRAAQLQECAKDLKGTLPFMEQLADPQGYLANNHICDAQGEAS